MQYKIALRTMSHWRGRKLYPFCMVSESDAVAALGEKAVAAMVEQGALTAVENAAASGAAQAPTQTATKPRKSAGKGNSDD